jgi:hypothetical protein
MAAMDPLDDLHRRVKLESARTRLALLMSAELKPRVEATLARSRVLHARLLSERLLAKLRL